MQVCTNSGTGIFTCGTQAVPSWTTGVGAIDVDGDSDNDLVIAGNGSGVYSCINDGSATFTCSTFGNGVTYARDVEVGRFNNDLYPDLVFADTNNRDDMVCLGGAGATFTCSVLDTGGNTYGAAIADLDGDNDLDVVLAREATPYRSCLNNAAGSFTCSDVTMSSVSGRDVALADVDGDSNVDMIMSTLGVNQICSGDGAGDVTGCTQVDTGSSWNSLGVAVVENVSSAVNDTWAGLPALRYGTGPNTLVFLDSGNASALADYQSWIASNPPIERTTFWFVPNLNITSVETAITPGATAWVGSYVFGQTYGGGVSTNVWYLRGGGVGATGTLRNPGLGNVIQWDTGTEFVVNVVTNYLNLYLPPDADGDGISDPSDNCPAIANPLQENFDADAEGDVCDNDDDNDGLDDLLEPNFGADPFNPDTDADTLTDGAEVNVHGTNPTLVDTDSDTLTDGAEVNVHGTNPTLVDTDSDTLSDGAEVNVHGTNPTLVDTDSDTLTDGDEVNVHGTNPTLVDTDSDTLTDAAEINVHLTDPTVTDTDSDALTDGDEVNTHLTDPLAPDTDSDTLTDGAEVNVHGTDPNLVDTDADSLTDGDEVNVHGSNPTLVDTDADALNDGIEVSVHGTDPVLSDTDVDALTDGGEVNVHGTNPLAVDTDLDTLTDGAEVTVHGTDPLAADTDLDTLTDGAEVTVHGTDPLSADTDLDTLSDGDEVNIHGTDPLSADTDADVLPDADEINLIGTDPLLVDTDTDALADGDEVNVHGTDPLVIDTDADALGDGDEVNVHGTDPLVDDTDLDGLTDGDEVLLHGTDPLLSDTDGDGYDDVTEIQNGWDAIGAPQVQTITLSVPASAPGLDGVVTATATATSSLPVELTTVGPCAVAGLAITPTGPGVCEISADQGGDGDFVPAATETATITFTTSTQTISIAAPTTMTAGDSTSIAAAATSGLTPTLAVTGPCTLSGSALAATGAGTCTITADQVGDTWYDAAPSATTTISISPAPTTTTTTTTTTTPTTVAPVTTSPAVTPTATTEVTATTEPAPTTSTTAVETTTTTTVVETADPTDVPEGTALVETSVDDLLVAGLPQQTGTSLRMVIGGLDDGTSGFMREGATTVEADETGDGSLVIDVDEVFPLAEATLVIEHPDGTITRITSADEFVDGDVQLALEFEVTPGEDAAQATVFVSGNGFVGGSDIDLTMRSEPVHLLTLAADDDGGFETNVVLPIEVEPGEHRVLATGVTADGPISGEWNFAVDAGGEVARVGDPEPGEAVVTPEGEPLPEPPAPAVAAIDELVEEPVAAAPTVDPTPEPDAAPEAEEPRPLDVATGLRVYEPVDEPEEVVADAVEAFALISLVAASSSLLAAGMAASSSMTGLASGGGLTTSAGSGTSGVAGRTGSRTAGSGGSSTSDEERGKGKIAGGKASKFGETIDGVAWGDASPTWRWPLTTRLDALGRRVPERLHPYSPLAARIVADGSTGRAVFGAGSLMLPILGVILGIAAALGTGGLPVAPALGLMLAMIVIGILDVSAGFAAATAFGIVVVASGGVTSADSVRAILGLSGLWFAIALIAGSVRAFRRGPSDDWAGRWNATAEIVMGSLLAAWTANTVVGSLPALSGLDMPIAEHADRVALVAIAALVARYLFERMAVRWYPERLIAVTFEPEDQPSKKQQVASAIVKAAMFAFVVIPYIGVGWELAVVVTLTIGPSIAGVWKQAFPNSSHLYRVLPKGVPNTLIMITIGATLSSVLAGRIENPQTLLAISFVVLAVPGFVLSVLGLVGREGADPEKNWPLRLAGAWVAFVAVLKIRGHLGGSPWVPVGLIAPLAVWWAIATAKAAALAAQESEEREESDEADAGDGDAEDRDDAALDPADDPYHDEVLTLAGLEELTDAEAAVAAEADEVTKSNVDSDSGIRRRSRSSSSHD